MLLPPLAQQQSSLIQEQVSLHWLKASQLFHPCRTPLMADPHTERTLHQHTAQVANIALHTIERGIFLKIVQSLILIRLLSVRTDLVHLVSCDGYLMHGVVD